MARAIVLQRRLTAALVCVALWALLPGCRPAYFSCTTSSQCVQGTMVGACVSSACAFADDGCESGLRFGSDGPTSLAGLCTLSATTDLGVARADMQPADLPHDGGGWDSSSDDLSKPCVDSSDTLFVDPVRGQDVDGGGTCAVPFKSIGAAAAAAGSSVGVTQLQLADGTYSSAETFPIQLPAGILVTGNPGTPSNVLVTGAGTCGNTQCAIYLPSQSGVQLRGMTITSSGLGISSSAASLTVDKTIFRSCATGIQTEGTLRITYSTFANNGSGIESGFSTYATLTSDTFNNNGVGIYFHNDSRLSTTNCTFYNNASRGVSFMHNVFYQSTGGDVFDSNGSAITVGNDPTGCGNLSFQIDGATITNSGTDAIAVWCTNASSLRNTTITGSGGSALFIQQSSPIDLGSSSSPGGNVLQSSDLLKRNANAGLCVGAAMMLTAQGNHFAHCPPVLSSTCSGAVDVGGPDGTLDLSDCVTP